VRLCGEGVLEENRRDAKDAEEEATAGVGTGALSGVNHRDTEIIVREFGIDGSRAPWSALACERFDTAGMPAGSSERAGDSSRFAGKENRKDAEDTENLLGALTSSLGTSRSCPCWGRLTRAGLEICRSPERFHEPNFIRIPV
jgi:hypothetical protein